MTNTKKIIRKPRFFLLIWFLLVFLLIPSLLKKIKLNCLLFYDKTVVLRLGDKDCTLISNDFLGFFHDICI